MNSVFIVVLRDDTQQDGTKGEYVLATRTAWTTREAAQRYASATAESRDAIVVECPRGVDFIVVER